MAFKAGLLFNIKLMIVSRLAFPAIKYEEFTVPASVETGVVGLVVTADILNE
jgi:hypothetical protein